jgi:DNA-binding MarR family transcriptional regulator
MSKPTGPDRAITLHVRDHCLCLHAQRVARALTRRFDAALRPLGLTSGQFSLMIALNRREPPAMGAVAALLAMDRTTLTAALKPLERRGLVAVALSETDRRSRRAVLTDDGLALLAQGVTIWRDSHDALDRDLETVGAVDAGNGLRAISDALRQP